MPFISETASAIKSRFGFHNRSASSESVPSVRSSPDLSLKSVPRDIPPVPAVHWDDNAVVATAVSSQSFEISEDPSFWKDHNVQVIIRIRPLSGSEISVQGYGKCVRQESCQTVTWKGHPESRFTFDLVADENVSQEKLFKVAGLPMVDNCMGGYNSCMFAYGQTGSGKTHTMLGDIEGGSQRHSVNCGMTPRVFECLFSRIQKEKNERKDEKIRFTCKCSFLEIYNEQILDLLDPSSNNLQIREDTKKGVYVENLKEIEVTSARDVIQQLIQGAANRKVAATNMNLASSRSHSVFTCIIESKWESQGVIHHRFARLNLVDLAGSERQKSSGAEGERLKEATNINKSLSTLGLVIMNLVNISNGKSLHVPYRDSKLTFLLQDSLGGNSKTTIIANISPSSCCSLETLSTLKFAQRAKFIKNNAIVNEDASGDVIAMRIQIQQLKKEVSHLRGLVTGGAESHGNDTLAVSFPRSPGPFKWEEHGLFSPLTSDKRMSRKKDYDVALVGAFRREKEKDIILQALTAENQATMQLAKQREDEIQGLKMRLRFREAGIKRLEAVASGKITAETHLLKEKEEYLKEIEVLRSRVDRNQEVTRFAMENLRLKEEIRRLKSFNEEGEREMMNEQITVLQNKLLEALDWKLMNEADSSAVQVNPNMVTEVCADGDLLLSSQELGSPWQSSIKEENEFLRMQAIHNQAEMETLQKQLEFCLEEKEKLERHVSDLVKKLEEETSSRAMKEEAQQAELPLSNDVPIINFNDQLELKTMVDAIAGASQREAEAHQAAIILSKENEELRSKFEVLNEEKSELTKFNDELRLKLKVLIEEKSKLIELYERAAAESNYENLNKAELAEENRTEDNNSGCLDTLVEQNEVEMTKVVENLEHQLMEMHEENEKLLGLYETAMQERDEFKRMISSSERNRAEARGEFDCPERLVEVDGGNHFVSDEPSVCTETKDVMDGTGLPGLHGQERGEGPNVETCVMSGEVISKRDVKDGLSLCFENSQAEEENEAEVQVKQFFDSSVGSSFVEAAFSDMEIEPSKLNKVSNDLNSVKVKLEKVQEKLSDSAKTAKLFGSIEKAFAEVDKLSTEIEAMEDSIQAKQQQLGSEKLLFSEMQEGKALVENKLSALKYSLSSISSSVAYFEQREDRSRGRVIAASTYLNQKKEESVHLQDCKSEIETALRKFQRSEAELRNNLAFLKLKLEEENNKRQENENVLFAIDNIEKIDHSQKHWGGKATDLLKSEEEKTKLQNEIKLSREKLGVVKREFEDWTKKSWKIDSDMQALQMEIQKSSRSVEELKHALEAIMKEKEALLEVKVKGKTEIESMIVEYQQNVFEADLKEAEMKILEGELKMELRRAEELQTLRSAAAEKQARLLVYTRSAPCLEEELESVGAYVIEAKMLLGEEQSN